MLLKMCIYINICSPRIYKIAICLQQADVTPTYAGTQKDDPRPLVAESHTIWTVQFF